MLCNPKRDAAIQVSNKLDLVKVVKWINDSRNHKSIQDATPPSPLQQMIQDLTRQQNCQYIYMYKRDKGPHYIYTLTSTFTYPLPPPTPRFDIAKLFNWLKVQFSIIIPCARYWYLSYNDENDKKKRYSVWIHVRTYISFCAID